MRKVDPILQQAFAKGIAPTDLNGFYKGKLNQALPGTAVEKVAGLLLKFYLPWYGKSFDKKHQSGNNLLPGYLASFIRSRYGESSIIAKEENRVHAFVFHTKVTKGLKDNVHVLQLNYDLPENPPSIKKIVDELVAIGDSVYLGKAYVKENNDYRLLAFFQLEK